MEALRRAQLLSSLFSPLNVHRQRRIHCNHCRCTDCVAGGGVEGCLGGAPCITVPSHAATRSSLGGAASTFATVFRNNFPPDRGFKTSPTATISVQEAFAEPFGEFDAAHLSHYLDSVELGLLPQLRVAGVSHNVIMPSLFTMLTI